ncbi:MFS transporter [Nocardia shimofusensis]|uniref:MFS transporter n=1 Tax=Nocardia shimofusensis TaxID=228596 RepID=UPI00082CE078|nr:MFS transporter [Nocardia shimofusensis]
MSPRMRVTPPLAWATLFAAIAQALAPVVAGLSGGASPDESTTDLYITPAGYAFSIWGVIYTLSIATTAGVVWKRATGTDRPDHLLTDLLITFLGASAWIAGSAAEIPWITPIILTIMTIALLDAVRLTASSYDESTPGWLTGLTRTIVGLYAAWASAAVFQNWASDIGASFGDPTVLWWQLAILILGALFGIAVTARYGGALPLYPIGLVWALIGILVTGWGEQTAVVVVCVIAVAGVAVAWWIARQRGPRRNRALGDQAL